MPHIPRHPKPPARDIPEATRAPLASRPTTEPTRTPTQYQPVRSNNGPGLPVISMQKHNVGPDEVARLLFGY